jgi:deoxyribonuclease V
MIACLDVDYRDAVACAAGVTFRDWLDAETVDERVVYVRAVEPYAPGQFFRRELPCLLAVLWGWPPVGIVVVDGYVWLDGMTKAGLGAHLYQALAERVPVIGVAKTRFRGALGAREVIRGESRRPLFITAAGMETERAAEHIRSMHGCSRIPTLLARVDFLCRHGGSPECNGALGIP